MAKWIVMHSNFILSNIKISFRLDIHRSGLFSAKQESWTRNARVQYRAMSFYVFKTTHVRMDSKQIRKPHVENVIVLSMSKR